MVSFSKLAVVLGMAVTAVTANHPHFLFRRFGDGDCEPHSHIRKDVHLKNDHCKTFSHNEVVFHGFNVRLMDHTSVYGKICQVQVYSDDDCKTEAFTYGDVSAHLDKCVSTNGMEGRSAKVVCGPVPASTLEMGETSTSTTTMTHTHSTPSPHTTHMAVVTAHVTASGSVNVVTQHVTQSHVSTVTVAPPTTMTLVPVPRGEKSCMEEP